jgi:hypothetical protein
LTISFEVVEVETLDANETLAKATRAKPAKMIDFFMMIDF